MTFLGSGSSGQGRGQGQPEPESGDVVIGLDVNCATDSPGMDGRGSVFRVRFSYRKRADGGPYPKPPKKPHPGPPPPPPGSGEPGPQLPATTASTSFVADGVSYIEFTVYGQTGPTGQGRGHNPEGRGDTSEDVAGRALEAVEEAEGRGDVGPGDIIVQHNGRPDNDGGCGRIIMRKPSHFDCVYNDGKLDIYYFDPDSCNPDENGEFPPAPPEGGPIGCPVYLKYTTGEWVPKGPPWAPPPTEGEKPLKDYKREINPGKGWRWGDWRKWWRKQQWKRPPKPIERWPTRYAHAPVGGDLDARWRDSLPFGVIIVVHEDDYREIPFRIADNASETVFEIGYALNSAGLHVPVYRPVVGLSSQGITAAAEFRVAGYIVHATDLGVVTLIADADGVLPAGRQRALESPQSQGVGIRPGTTLEEFNALAAARRYGQDGVGS